MSNYTNCYYLSNAKFSLKDPKLEFSAIRLRIPVNRVRISLHLDTLYKIRPRHWCNITKRAIEDPKQNLDLKGNPLLQVQLHNINTEIDKTSNAFIRVMENFKLQNIKPMADQVKAGILKELRGIQPENKIVFKDFISYIDSFIVLCREGSILNSKGTKLVSGSIRNYISTQSAIRRYSNDRRVKLTLDTINMAFYADFMSYLTSATHSRGQYRPSVMGKFVRNIKVFMRYAYENGYTMNDDFKRKEFKVFNENSESIYLNIADLEVLLRLELPANEAQVRDGFLISCCTGLRYSDISRLEKKHIDFKKKTISIVTQKTNVRVDIPLHYMVKDILEIYGNKPPKIQCNQSTNRMLKRICRKAGITDPITIMETKGGVRKEATYEKCDMVTSHTARRSFATNTFKSGMESISIMTMTGHKTENNFMRYIRITSEENAKILQGHDFFNAPR